MKKNRAIYAIIIQFLLFNAFLFLAARYFYVFDTFLRIILLFLLIPLILSLFSAFSMPKLFGYKTLEEAENKPYFNLISTLFTVFIITGITIFLPILIFTENGGVEYINIKLRNQYKEITVEEIPSHDKVVFVELADGKPLSEYIDSVVVFEKVNVNKPSGTQEIFNFTFYFVIPVVSDNFKYSRQVNAWLCDRFKITFFKKNIPDILEYKNLLKNEKFYELYLEKINQFSLINLPDTTPVAGIVQRLPAEYSYYRKITEKLCNEYNWNCHPEAIYLAKDVPFSKVMTNLRKRLIKILIILNFIWVFIPMMLIFYRMGKVKKTPDI